MNHLVATYMNEVAEGRLPGKHSVERQAYEQWAKETDEVRRADLEAEARESIWAHGELSRIRMTVNV